MVVREVCLYDACTLQLIERQVCSQDLESLEHRYPNCVCHSPGKQVCPERPAPRGTSNRSVSGSQPLQEARTHVQCRGNSCGCPWDGKGDGRVEGLAVWPEKRGPTSDASWARRQVEDWTCRALLGAVPKGRLAAADFIPGNWRAVHWGAKERRGRGVYIDPI